MRIDIFTEFLDINSNKYLINLRTAAVDEIDHSLASHLEKLKSGGSFSSKECNIDDRLLEELLEKGYIINYSDKELYYEKNTLFETYKEKIKLTSKVPSLVLDNVVGMKWCRDMGNYNDRNWKLDRDAVENVLNKISHDNRSGEVDVWLDFNTNYMNLQWLKKCVEKRNLQIKKIYLTCVASCCLIVARR